MAEKKVTMYTIARALGVSVAAVSRAFTPDSRLKPEKRQLILETAERLGYVQNKLAARLSAQTIRIGVLIYGTIAQYYNEYIAGIRAAQSEYADYKVDCELVVLHRRVDLETEAIAVIERFIEEKFDAVILSGFSRSSDIAGINRLADVGIPFVILGSDIPGCLRSGVSMNDTATAGRLAAQLTSLSIRGGSRKAAILCADLADTSQQGLVSSFCASAEHFGIEAASILPTFNRYETACTLTQSIIQKYPDIGAIYVSSANSIAVCREISEAGLSGKLGLITSDIFDELNGFIRDGTVLATIYQDPISQARSAFEALFFHLTDGDPIPEFILTRPRAVFESDLELYTK